MGQIETWIGCSKLKDSEGYEKCRWVSSSVKRKSLSTRTRKREWVVIDG